MTAARAPRSIAFNVTFEALEFMDDAEQASLAELLCINLRHENPVPDRDTVWQPFVTYHPVMPGDPRVWAAKGYPYADTVKGVVREVARLTGAKHGLTVEPAKPVFEVGQLNRWAVVRFRFLAHARRPTRSQKLEARAVILFDRAARLMRYMPHLPMGHARDAAWQRGRDLALENKRRGFKLADRAMLAQKEESTCRSG